jgi:predicted acetyltransferase
MLRDRPARRGGASPLQHLVHPDGYLSYRTKLEWDGGEPNGTCEIVDYAPVTPQAHAALWQVLLGLDLTARINSFRIPVDDPLPVLLSDPRAVDVAHVGDGTWVRPVAVPALLSGRRYGLDVDCVVEVRDEVLGDGRYRLSGGPEGAVSEWTSAPADVTMRVADLGSLVVGGERLQRLARAGVVDCRNPALLARLDLALLADRAPFHGTQF